MNMLKLIKGSLFFKDNIWFLILFFQCFMLFTVPDMNMEDRRKHNKGIDEFRYIKFILASLILKFQRIWFDSY